MVEEYIQIVDGVADSDLVLVLQRVCVGDSEPSAVGGHQVFDLESGVEVDHRVDVRQMGVFREAQPTPRFASDQESAHPLLLLTVHAQNHLPLARPLLQYQPLHLRVRSIINIYHYIYYVVQIYMMWMQIYIMIFMYIW